MMQSSLLTQITEWIECQLASLHHGEIHLLLKIHDGRIAFIEKSKVEKEKPV